MNRRVFLSFPLITWALTRKAHAFGHNYYCQWRDKKGAFLREKNIIIGGADTSEYTMHRDEAFATGMPQTVLVENNDTFKTVIGDIRGGRLPPQSIAAFDLSRYPERVIEAFEKKIGQVKVYHNVPASSAEAITVHGRREFGETQQSGLSNETLFAYKPIFDLCTRRLNAVGAIKIASGSDMNAAEWFQRELKNYKSNDLIVVVSHVVKYGIIRLNTANKEFSYPSLMLPLTDGSVFKPADVVSRGPEIWIVGCDTWDYISQLPSLNSPQLAFTAKISYPVAVEIAKEARNGGSLREILHRIQMRDWRFTPSKRPQDVEPGGDHPSISPPPSAAVVVAAYITEGNALFLQPQVV